MVSDKLKAVDTEENDQEIQAIREALDGLLSGAQSGEADVLPAKCDALKARFVKVCVKRGQARRAQAGSRHSESKAAFPSSSASRFMTQASATMPMTLQQQGELTTMAAPRRGHASAC